MPKKLINAFILLSFLFTMSCTVSCGCGSSPGIVAAETAAAACAIEQVQQYGGSVKDALSQPDYTGALKQISTKSALTDAALKCIVRTVIAVLTAPSAPAAPATSDAGVTAAASTERPLPAVVNGKAWLEAHP